MWLVVQDLGRRWVESKPSMGGPILVAAALRLLQK